MGNSTDAFKEGIKFDSLPRVESNNVFVDGTDAYANNHKAFITFYYVPNQRAVAFKASVTNFSDNYNSDWKSEAVYGRADPIYTYKNTKRTISLGFDIVASTDPEAFGNLEKIQKLTQFMYPAYAKPDQAQTISNSPLVKIGFMNLVTDSSSTNVTFEKRYGRKKPNSDNLKEYDLPVHSNGVNGINGLLGVITSINYDFPSIKDGNSLIGKGAIYPRFISVSVNFEPIHQLALDGSIISKNTNFPYATNLHSGDNKQFQISPDSMNVEEVYGTDNTQSGVNFINNVVTEGRKRQATLAKTQQDIDKANARYNSLFGGLREKRDEKMAIDYSNDKINSRTMNAYYNYTTYHTQDQKSQEATEALSEPWWIKS